MTDEERTRRIERAVLRRIDRRAAVVRAVGRGAVAVVLIGAVVGGIAALRPGVGTGASSGAAGGSAAREPDSSAAASGDSVAAPASGTAGGDRTVLFVRCHATAARDSAAQIARVTGGRAGVAAACAAAFQRPVVPIVLCQTSYRGNDLAAHPGEAYPADAHPDTLCVRNGLKPPG